MKVGKIRSIDLSNYYIKEMTEFLPKVDIKPVLVQNEIHPYCQEKGIVEFMHEQGIVVEEWYQYSIIMKTFILLIFTITLTFNSMAQEKIIQTAGHIAYGRLPGEARKDQEGVANMKNLGQSIAWLLNRLKD